MALTRPRAYQIFDLDYKQAVRVVTLSNVILSGGAPNAVDGVNLSINDRILVAGQTNAVQNGIYYVTVLGTGANGTWARSIDSDTTGELEGGTVIMVTEGTTYADTQWKLTTNDPIVIGVTALTFVQNYLANSISYGQTSFAIASANANATISVAGTSNVAVFATTGAFVTGVVSATGNVVGANILTTGLISATGAITGAAITGSSLNLSTGNITAGNLNATGISLSGNIISPIRGSTTIVAGSTISAAGNITGANINTAGLVSATGAVNAGSVAAGTTISAAGNITGANIVTSGLITATGNLISGNVNLSGNIVDTGALFLITGSSGNVTLAPNGSNVVIATTTGANITGTLNATGSANVGNLGTAGLITATGSITGASINVPNAAQALTATPSLGFVIEPSFQPNYIGTQPFGSSMWVDKLRFIQPNIVETSTDGTAWTSTTDATYTQRPFNGVVTQSTIPMNGTTLKGLRWTWSSNIQFSGAYWLGIAFQFSSPAPTCNIQFETSTDGIAWTSRYTTSNFTVSNEWAYIYTPENNFSTQYYRITLLQQTGTVNFNALQWYTARPGDQGSGQNNYFPFTYDFSKNVTFPNTATVTGNISAGNISTTGLLTATGNITGGNLRTSAVTIASTGAISGVTTISASGNANVGNLGATNAVITGSLTGVTTISASGNANVGNLITTGTVSTGTLSASGNVTVAGNLTVSGNVISVNVTDLNVVDPIIGLGRGPNNAPLTTNDGKDRGEQLWYYTTSEQSAFIGYDNSAGKLIAATNVSVSNEVVTVNNYGNIIVGGLESTTISATGNANVGNLGTAGQIVATGNVTAGGISTTGNITAAFFLGNVSQASGIFTTKIFNGTSEANIGASGGNLSISIGGTSNVMVVSTASANVSGTLGVTGNVTGGNIITAGLVTATGNINTSANVSAVGNIAGNYFVGNGSQLTGILTGNSFGTIVVSGQSNVVADSASDTLTLIAGSGIAIVTDSGNDSVTISQVATDSIFATGGDMGTVTEAVTASEDLGLITSAATVEYDLGTLTTGGIITPSYLLLPSYTVSQLASLTANPAGQFVFCSNESGGSVPAFSDGTNWRRVTDRAIVS